MYREPGNKERNAEFYSFMRRKTKEKEILTHHAIVQGVKKNWRAIGVRRRWTVLFHNLLGAPQRPFCCQTCAPLGFSPFQSSFGPSFTLSGSRGGLQLEHGLRACDTAEQTQINNKRGDLKCQGLLMKPQHTLQVAQVEGVCSLSLSNLSRYLSPNST